MRSAESARGTSGGRGGLADLRLFALLGHARVLGLIAAAARADEQLLAGGHRKVQIRVEATLRVHLRVALGRCESSGLPADRAGAWAQRDLLCWGDRGQW